MIIIIIIIIIEVLRNMFAAISGLRYRTTGRRIECRPWIKGCISNSHSDDFSARPFSSSLSIYEVLCLLLQAGCGAGGWSHSNRSPKQMQQRITG